VALAVGTQGLVTRSRIA